MTLDKVDNHTFREKKVPLGQAVYFVARCSCGWFDRYVLAYSKAKEVWKDHLREVVEEEKDGNSDFVLTLGLNYYRDEVHSYAKAKGWWEEDRTFGDLIALCHSELSEALEDYRKGKRPAEQATVAYSYPEDQEGKPVGIPSELADTIIRILDMCGYYGIDIEKAYQKKMKYNRQRDHRHGGKTL